MLPRRRDRRRGRQLLARQVQGKYKINASHLRVLREEAVALCRRFSGGVTLTHVLRGDNARADALANQGVRAGRP